MAAADICVLPSRYEPFGTVMSEAWHSRVPLVATRAAGATQYVADGIDGLLCDIDDPDGLAGQIQRVLRDAGLRKSLIESGYKKYEQMFSMNVAMNALCETYARIRRIGKPARLILRDEDIETDETFDRNVLSPPVAGEGPGRELQRLVHAYNAWASDTSLGIDAFRLQSLKLYNFLREGGCEIWSAEEMDLALENIARPLQHARLCLK